MKVSGHFAFHSGVLATVRPFGCHAGAMGALSNIEVLVMHWCIV